MHAAGFAGFFAAAPRYFWFLVFNVSRLISPSLTLMQIIASRRSCLVPKLYKPKYLDISAFSYTGCSKKTDSLVYFDDNFGKYGPILTIFLLLQQEIYEAQKLSYFSHLTFIMLPLYLAKETLMLVSMQIFLDHASKQISMYSSG